MPTRENLLVGELLVDEGVITVEQLESGLKEQKRTGEFICTTLVKLGYAPEEKVFSLLSRQLNIPYVRLKNKEIEHFVIEKVSAKFASHYKIIPIECKDSNLTLAMTNPLDVRTIDDIKLLLNLEVKTVLASELEILEAIRKYYGVGADTLEQITSSQSIQHAKLQTQEAEDIESLAEDASIIKFVNQILSEAIKDRATDIHIEPFADELRVRFRIDGMLYIINIPETIKYFHPAIVSRIKVMSQMNIAERRLPQDGRMKVKINDQEVDIRISTLPSGFGEAVHMRILSQRSFIELEKLGLLQQDLDIIERVIKRPHGIIFVTGPTGSGKSTTLYACLARINSAAIKIITVEDPIEYQLKGVNQVQMQPKIGLDFATGLRHMLRHDPDVMMVGEVRDYETAEIAIRAALTGHLVFSTLHTNDSSGAITRLIDMGIEPFLVSSSIECLIAQRLIRLVCPRCKTPLTPEARQETLSHIKDFDVPAEIELVEGKGCEECRFTGFRGRTAIYEVLTIDEAIRELIVVRASAQAIKQKAVSTGMRTLRQDGIRKMLKGLTTYSEILRVTQQEELPE